MQKLNSQINAFETLGHNVWFTDIDDEGCWLVHGNEKKRLFAYRQYTPAGISAHANSARLLLHIARQYGQQFDLCYIRKPLCGPSPLKALRILRQKGVAVVEEIPTFPYDAELERQQSLASRLFLAIDRTCRKRLHRYVNFISTYSFDETIFGVPAITLQNAIAVERFPLHSPSSPPTTALRMIAVSSMCFWHGYDRLIRGLAAYKNNSGSQRHIHLHLVGDGPEFTPWQTLANELGVAKMVTFHGAKTGAELDNLFNQCDIGIASLGGSRKGLYDGFELKTREYIARGLPFVHSLNDPAATAVLPYSCHVANDESDVPICTIAAFWDDIRSLADNGSALLRQYAEENLRWEAQMQKIIDAVRRQ